MRPSVCAFSYIEAWVVVSNVFDVHPYLGKWSNLTSIFQMGWNHQLENYLNDPPISFGLLSIHLTPSDVANKKRGIAIPRPSFPNQDSV